jgi:hypothetical protein
MRRFSSGFPSLTPLNGTKEKTEKMELLKTDQVKMERKLQKYVCKIISSLV